MAKNFSGGVESLFAHHVKNAVEEHSADVEQEGEKRQVTTSNKTANPTFMKPKTIAVVSPKKADSAPVTYANRTYSISRKIINAIADYSYHNKVDKNSIVNDALKEFLGEYYDNAEE
jgi:hypothetical protein